MNIPCIMHIVSSGFASVSVFFRSKTFFIAFLRTASDQWLKAIQYAVGSVEESRRCIWIVHIDWVDMIPVSTSFTPAVGAKRRRISRYCESYYPDRRAPVWRARWSIAVHSSRCRCSIKSWLLRWLQTTLICPQNPLILSGNWKTKEKSTRIDQMHTHWVAFYWFTQKLKCYFMRTCSEMYTGHTVNELYYLGEVMMMTNDPDLSSSGR